MNPVLLFVVIMLVMAHFYHNQCAKQHKRIILLQPTGIYKCSISNLKRFFESFFGQNGWNLEAASPNSLVALAGEQYLKSYPVPNTYTREIRRGSVFSGDLSISREVVTEHHNESRVTSWYVRVRISLANSQPGKTDCQVDWEFVDDGTKHELPSRMDQWCLCEGLIDAVLSNFGKVNSSIDLDAASSRMSVAFNFILFAWLVTLGSGSIAYYQYYQTTLAEYGQPANSVNQAAPKPATPEPKTTSSANPINSTDSNRDSSLEADTWKNQSSRAAPSSDEQVPAENDKKELNPVIDKVASSTNASSNSGGVDETSNRATLGVKPAVAPQPDVDAAPESVRKIDGLIACESSSNSSGGDSILNELVAGSSATAEEHNNEQAMLLNKSGLSALKMKRYQEATDYFARALEVDRSDPKLLSNLGYAQTFTGELASAKKNLYQSIYLAPKRSVAWGDLGLVLAKQHEQSKAVACFLIGYKVSGGETLGFLQSLDKDDDIAVRLAGALAVQKVSQANQSE